MRRQRFAKIIFNLITIKKENDNFTSKINKIVGNIHACLAENHVELQRVLDSTN